MSHKVTNTTSNDNFYITFNLTFNTAGTKATGRVSADGPTLFPLGAKPTKAALCKSSPKTMTVNFQPPSAKITPQPVGALMLGKVQSVQPLIGVELSREGRTRFGAAHRGPAEGGVAAVGRRSVNVS